MNLFFRKLGQGPPLIIIHGLYGSSDNWFTIGKKLAENFEVYLIDQRNHGQSPHTPDHNYSLLKEDLKEFMDQQLIEKAIIIGHSMGGKTAMYFSADYPERITSLIVVDISPLSYLSTNSFQLLQHKTIIKIMAEIDFSTITSREQVDGLLSGKIVQKQVRQFLLKNLKRSHNNKFYWSINISALQENLQKIIDGLSLQDFANKKTITGFPVLFIKGSESDYILENDQRAITTIYPQAEIKTIQNAGHWVHAEQPDEFMKVVTLFLQQ